MTSLLVTTSGRWRNLLRFAAWAALIVLFLASLPSCSASFGQTLGWFSGLFRRSNDLWKECPWCF